MLKDIIAPLHDKYLSIFRQLTLVGELKGRRIVICDPDSPKIRNIYEDLDLDDANIRQMLVTEYPQYSEALEDGEDGADYQTVLTHPKAIRDIDIMLRQGWLFLEICRDLRHTATAETLAANALDAIMQDGDQDECEFD